MIPKSKILVVEDEEDVQELILLHLKRDGHQVQGVETAESALKLIENEKFDLLVLDWMLPGMSGLELCKKIDRKIPILMVTARAETSDIVLGLELGADDYVIKPFEISVLNARVRALLRRASSPAPQSSKDTLSGKIELGKLVINLDAHQVFCANEEVLLTPSEFKLLVALIKNKGRVLTRDKLIELVQGEGVSVVDRAIDTHVFGLRKKLGLCSETIETIRGVGYRVCE